MMRRLSTAALLSASVAASGVARADEFPIGEALVKEGLRIVPCYVTGVQLDKTPAGMGIDADTVHLQADIHATKDEAHGFAEGAWMPYLTIGFALTKDGVATYKKNGFLYPVAAKDGPHYAANVDLAGPGTYHLTAIISPPTSHGLLRHVDKSSGVPDWWKPITASWTFTYPDKSK